MHNSSIFIVILSAAKIIFFSCTAKKNTKKLSKNHQTAKSPNKITPKIVISNTNSCF